MASPSCSRMIDILQDTSLGTLLATAQSKHLFAKSLWCRDFTLDDFETQKYESFFFYCRDQCATALSDNPKSLKSHGDILNIIRSFTSRTPSSEPPYSQESLSPLGHDEEERYWINFAARVLTMIDVGELRQGVRLGQTPRTWTHGTLKEFVSSCFPKTVQLERVKLEKIFNARNLEHIAGIQVIWTSNMADHLQLEDDDTRVKLFSHASFLDLHRTSYV
jgi:hypothetical protein